MAEEWLSSSDIEVDIGSMKLFLKYAILAFGVQTVVLLFLMLAGSISPAAALVFEILLRIYMPMILLIVAFGNFKGESAMIEPVWMGIALGVLCYSILFGFVVSLLRRGR